MFDRTLQTVTILSGTDTSGAFSLGPGAHIGIQFDATMTSATATFLVSHTETGTYAALTDSAGGTPGVVATSGTTVGVVGTEREALAAFNWAKIVTNGNEGADRDIKVSVLEERRG